ncbi:hypothetical protein ACIO8F_39825 [Streptomyces sp. NPDC087228]|uniref:hypothetical protein n=1 Tax=unclassified Streptomyces TaxID=2593676 RepID=UPI003801C32B
MRRHDFTSALCSPPAGRDATIGLVLAVRLVWVASTRAARTAKAAPVDYTAEREEHLPPEQRGHYRVLQDIQRIPGPRKRDPVLQVRRILVHSTGNAAGQRQARTKRLAKATAELKKVQRGAGGRGGGDGRQPEGVRRAVRARRE